MTKVPEISLKDRGLPKWPQMLVLGEAIDSMLAEEIIRRTDTFFYGYGGNNRTFDTWLSNLLGIPNIDDYNAPYQLRLKRLEQLNKWQEVWGSVETSYVRNSWISSAFVFGPYGWCNPNGTIAFVDNVGKWPSIKSIRSDWAKLAAAFPALKLDVTLWSGEQCEDDKEPIVGMMVRNGKVRLVSPTFSKLYKDFGVSTMEAAIDMAYSSCDRSEEAMMRRFKEPRLGIPTGSLMDSGVRKVIPLTFEQGIALPTLERWHKKAFELGLVGNEGFSDIAFSRALSNSD